MFPEKLGFLERWPDLAGQRMADVRRRDATVCERTASSKGKMQSSRSIVRRINGRRPLRQAQTCGATR